MGTSCCVLVFPMSMPDTRSISSASFSKHEPEFGTEAEVQQTWLSQVLVFPIIWLSRTWCKGIGLADLSSLSQYRIYASGMLRVSVTALPM